MASSRRIKGVSLLLDIDEVEYDCDVTACSITNEESDDDVVTFCDVAEGDNYDYVLNIEGIQSTDEDSLWSYIWDHTGDEVAFVYAPHGNATASKNEPHFTGTVKIGPPPEIGGEAGKDNTYTFESEWEIVGKPAIDRGSND